MDARSPWSNPHLLLALTSFFWGAQWVVARAIVPYTTPIGIGFWRWAVAIALLAPIAGPVLARQWPAVRRAWRPILFFGTCGTVLYNSIGYAGIQQSSAINALLFQSVTPLIIPLFAWALFRERVPRSTAAGLAVSLCGVLAIVSRLDLRALAALELNPGDFYLLTNVAFWALYTACLRWTPRELDPLAFMLAVMLAGMLTGIPGWLADLALGGRFELRTGSLLGVLYIGAFPSLLCYMMWNRGVAAVGPARAGAYLHLAPLFGTLMAMAFLGEQLQLFHVLGFALILGGVYIAARPGS